MKDFVEKESPKVSVESYIGDPLGAGISLPRLSDVARGALVKLLSSPKAFPHILWGRMKMAKEALVSDGFLRDFPLRLRFGFKPVAYMRDGGEVCFTTGALLFRSSAVTLSVFCHELSHMYLSQRSFYPELKELQGEFLERFSSESGCELMSPIELYAMALSVDIMDNIAQSLVEGKHKDKLRLLIDSEREKITFLVSKIKKLK